MSTGWRHRNHRATHVKPRCADGGSGWCDHDGGTRTSRRRRSCDAATAAGAFAGPFAMGGGRGGRGGGEGESLARRMRRPKQTTLLAAPDNGTFAVVVVAVVANASANANAISRREARRITCHDDRPRGQRGLLICSQHRIRAGSFRRRRSHILIRSSSTATATARSSFFGTKVLRALFAPALLPVEVPVQVQQLRPSFLLEQAAAGRMGPTQQHAKSYVDINARESTKQQPSGRYDGAGHGCLRAGDPAAEAAGTAAW